MARTVTEIKQELTELNSKLRKLENQRKQEERANKGRVELGLPENPLSDIDDVINSIKGKVIAIREEVANQIDEMITEPTARDNLEKELKTRKEKTENELRTVTASEGRNKAEVLTHGKVGNNKTQQNNVNAIKLLEEYKILDAKMAKLDPRKNYRDITKLGTRMDIIKQDLKGKIDSRIFDDPTKIQDKITKCRTEIVEYAKKNCKGVMPKLHIKSGDTYITEELTEKNAEYLLESFENVKEIWNNDLKNKLKLDGRMTYIEDILSGKKSVAQTFEGLAQKVVEAARIQRASVSMDEAAIDAELDVDPDLVEVKGRIDAKENQITTKQDEITKKQGEIDALKSSTAKVSSLDPAVLQQKNDSLKAENNKINAIDLEIDKIDKEIKEKISEKDKKVIEKDAVEVKKTEIGNLKTKLEKIAGQKDTFHSQKYETIDDYITARTKEIENKLIIDAAKTNYADPHKDRYDKAYKLGAYAKPVDLPKKKFWQFWKKEEEPQALPAGGTSLDVIEDMWKYPEEYLGSDAIQEDLIDELLSSVGDMEYNEYINAMNELEELKKVCGANGIIYLNVPIGNNLGKLEFDISNQDDKLKELNDEIDNLNGEIDNLTNDDKVEKEEEKRLLVKNRDLIQKEIADAEILADNTVEMDKLTKEKAELEDQEKELIKQKDEIQKEYDEKRQSKKSVKMAMGSREGEDITGITDEILNGNKRVGDVAQRRMDEAINKAIDDDSNMR